MGTATPSALSRALYVGFAGLLLLMAVIAVDSGHSLREVESTSSIVRRESRGRDALLDQLRLDIYRAATVMRDHLLELDDNRAASHKAELGMLYVRTTDTLRQYAATMSAGEQGTFKKLQYDVDVYWLSLTSPLGWDAAARRSDGGDYLNRVVLPRRSEAVDLIRQITLLNERDLDAGEGRIRTVGSNFRRRVTAVSLVGLLLGAVLAAFSIRRIQRLEVEAEKRYREVEVARGELSRLSALLVRAQEEERRRLSRELHDEIGQSMSAILMELHRLESSPPDPETRRQRFASLRGLAERTVAMVRNMALLLRPSMLDDLGLVAALRWQAKEVSRRTGIRVRVSAEEIPEDPPEPIRTCLYRVAQEALHNCARHSGASLARVVVRQSPNILCLSIEDDGIGFEAGLEKGLGLLGMEERVESLGGIFSIESQPGVGTVLSASFAAQEQVNV
jgi:signal transduction histidine kinase